MILRGLGMNIQLKKKHEKLRTLLKNTKGCAVAFSGGVDSTLVLTVAHEMLGDRSLAVIATSSTYTQREFKQALDWVKKQNIPYVVIESEELDIEEFSNNPVNRCYYCKHELFSKVRKQAAAHELEWIADGTNADDIGDHRPGLQAARELHVLSPLCEAGLTKNELRTIAREVYDLPVADKPAMACLASRFPYGSSITSGKLDQVGKMEVFLCDLGFEVYRARHHGDIVRLELGPAELEKAMLDKTRNEISSYGKSLGFRYVTLDLEGYRTGSMNEGLTEKENEAE